MAASVRNASSKMYFLNLHLVYPPYSVLSSNIFIGGLALEYLSLNFSSIYQSYTAPRQSPAKLCKIGHFLNLNSRLLKKLFQISGNPSDQNPRLNTQQIEELNGGYLAKGLQAISYTNSSISHGPVF